MKTTTILLVFTLLFWGNINSQQLISCSGGHFETVSYSLSWSIGEISTETYNSGSIILTQGIHQHYFSITEIENNLSKEINVKVFPNPATNYLNIETNSNELFYSISDITGKIIIEGKTFGKENIIKISKLHKSIYLLRISNIKTNQTKTFKIIKRSAIF